MLFLLILIKINLITLQGFGKSEARISKLFTLCQAFQVSTVTGKEKNVCFLICWLGIHCSLGSFLGSFVNWFVCLFALFVYHLFVRFCASLFVHLFVCFSFIHLSYFVCCVIQVIIITSP
jgi:hypothetical protein